MFVYTRYPNISILCFTGNWESKAIKHKVVFMYALPKSVQHERPSKGIPNRIRLEQISYENSKNVTK